MQVHSRGAGNIREALELKRETHHTGYILQKESRFILQACSSPPSEAHRSLMSRQTGDGSIYLMGYTVIIFSLCTQNDLSCAYYQW